VGTSIALVGPGAIGSTLAAFLHAAGHQVLLCGRTPKERIEVRPDNGEPIVLPGPVHTEPAEAPGPVDVVLLGVKDTQNEAAAAWLEKLCDERTVVCALQNGVEQVERVGRYCGAAQVVPAVVWFSAKVEPEGWVRLRTGVRLVLPDSAAAATLAELMRPAGVTVELDPDFATETWRKLLTNAVAGLMVLTGRHSGMFRRDDIAALARRYLAEGLPVARAEGADLDESVIDDIVHVDPHRPGSGPAAGVGHP
jgi:2-dehydropantoate 2-reductase